MGAAVFPAPHIYRRRRPESTDLYQAVRENLEPFYDAYDHGFIEQHGPLPPVARSTLDVYLRCGRLWAGVARAKCDDCHSEILVALTLSVSRGLSFLPTEARRGALPLPRGGGGRAR